MRSPIATRAIARVFASAPASSTRGRRSAAAAPAADSIAAPSSARSRLVARGDRRAPAAGLRRAARRRRSPRARRPSGRRRSRSAGPATSPSPWRSRRRGPRAGRGASPSGSRRLLGQVGVDHRDVGVARERDLADEAVVEQAAERVDVRAAVDLAALDLLGRDVVDRADDVARARDLRAPAPSRRLVSPKSVRNARRPSISTFAGLTSRWIRPERVRGVERGGDLAADVDRAVRAQAALARSARRRGPSPRRTASPGTAVPSTSPAS